MFDTVNGFAKAAGQTHNGEGLFSDADTVALRLRLITEEFLELTEAMHKAHHEPTTDNKAHALKEMCDLLYVTLGLGVVFFKPDVCTNAYAAVHDNNMTKVTGAVDKDNGKVTKPKNYKPVDLTPLVRGESL